MTVIPRHVLAVDDDAAIRDLFIDIFEAEGYRVTVVATLAAAENCLLTDPPDLIVLDYYFGGQPLGRSWLRTVRAEPRTRYLPVLVCSAAQHAVATDAEECAAQHVAYLEKPFALEPLLHMVQDLLRYP